MESKEKRLSMIGYGVAPALIFIGIATILINGTVDILAVFKLPYNILPSIYYVGSPLHFIVFGYTLLFFTYKFGKYSIPIFLVTYTAWEFNQGIYTIFRSISTTITQEFIVIAILSIISLIPLIGKIKIKINPTLLLIVWIGYGVINFVLSSAFGLFIESIWTVLFCFMFYDMINLKTTAEIDEWPQQRNQK